MDAAAVGYAGATAATAPAAELTAALVVLKLIGEEMRSDAAAVSLMIDASHTVAVVMFECAVQKQQQLARRVRACSEMVSSMRHMRCIRVPGHAGLPGNELADLAATLGAEGSISDQACMESLSTEVEASMCRRRVSFEADIFWSDALERCQPHSSVGVLGP